MPYSEEWKKAIGELLDAEGIGSAAKAARRSKGSATYWQEWRRDGRLPTERQAREALEPFLPTHPEQVLRAMAAGGFVAPPEWLRPSDPIEAVISVLREVCPDTTEDTFDRVREVMAEVLSHE